MTTTNEERVNKIIANLEATMTRLRVKWCDCQLVDLTADISQLRRIADGESLKSQICTLFLRLAEDIYQMRTESEANG